MNRKQREKLSDYLLDTSKLITAGAIIGVVVEYNVNKLFILVIGLATSIIFALAGFNYLKKSKEDKK